MRPLFSFLLLFSAIANAQTPFDIQGHRGCRGLMPENTIPAFLKAIDLGVNTLELDVVVTADSQLIVSHEPFMNADIATYPDGTVVKEGDKDKTNIYKLTYAQVQGYDVGSRGNPKFVEQQKMKVGKPLLKDVITAVEKYIKDNNLPPVYYNIETKCTPEGDNTFHPAPDRFAEMLFQVINDKGITDKCIIQSFDIRTLQHLHKAHPQVKLALLVGNLKTLEGNVKALGFTPYILSPQYLLVNKKLVNKCHKKGMKVIPWTVNDADKMKALKADGVDGLITDYPDIAIKTLSP